MLQTLIMQDFNATANLILSHNEEYNKLNNLFTR